MILLRFFLIFFFNITMAFATASADEANRWYTRDDSGQVQIKVALFLSSTCGHCQKADAFFKQLQQENDWLLVKRYVIDKSLPDLEYYNQVLKEFKASDFAVPSIVFCGVRWRGFDSAATTGKNLSNSLRFCHSKVTEEGRLSAQNQAVLERWAVNAMQTITRPTSSGLSYAVGMALGDAINPCAFFAFGLFISFLSIFPMTRQRLKAGFLMLSAILIIHFLQQDNAPLYVHTIHWLRWPAFICGLVALYFIHAYYRQKNLLEATGFTLAFVMLALVFLYQQQCTEINFSLFYQTWLEDKSLSFWGYWYYQAIYQAIYMLPLIILFALMLFYLSRKHSEKLQQVLRYAAGFFLLFSALLLMFYPYALSHLNGSGVCMLIALGLGNFIQYRQQKREK